MKRSFSSKYEVPSKSIETEAIFTKREMNNEWNVYFFPNSALGIRHAFPANFLLTKALQKLLFLYGAVEYTECFSAEG